MMQKVIDYFGGEKRFYTIMIVLILMWLGMIAFFWLKADEVTKNPCSVCAKKLDSEIVCSIRGGGMIRERIFYPDLSITTTLDGLDENNPLT
ncbi:hypothetical protein LCGC14_2756680 [marine sediment metagenome]|uniref:Uncharacterized protein n=1 Tax=marine sediment metagenome TaxID=412755 RepID=A0A0F8Z030_9ZZZZ